MIRGPPPSIFQRYVPERSERSAALAQSLPVSMFSTLSRLLRTPLRPWGSCVAGNGRTKAAMHPAPRLFAPIVAAILVACDGDGNHGGPNGGATRFCQRALANLGHDGGPGALASACESCCLQEVPYKGHLENGACVCRR